MIAYLLHLKERGYAATTQARKIAAAKSFFGFMVREGHLKLSPTENIGAPNVGRPLPRPISVSQVRRLLDQPAASTSLLRGNGTAPCWSCSTPAA